MASKIRGKFVSESKKKKSDRLKEMNKRKARLDNIDDHNYVNNDDNRSTFVDVNLGENVEVGVPKTWFEGRHIVELKTLAEQLECDNCSAWLRLTDIEGERIYGLGSALMIRCSNPTCGHVKPVFTGKRNERGAFDINAKVTLAMLHAGMGPTHVNNFLTTCNLPPVDPKTLKKKEKELTSAITATVQESCREARAEEKDLSNGDVELSFDAGWQQRGSGWLYNSNTGHSSVIGVKTGKVLDFDVRTKVCSVCWYHQGRNETVPNHECNTNWTGSSKAMEPDMATSLLKRLDGEDCRVGVLHADNDSTTSSRLRANFREIEKVDDKNHVKKNLSKRLYTLAKSHRPLKVPGVIPYIVRCFMYAISTKRDSDQQLKDDLQRIVPHIFGDHSQCLASTWCRYHKDPLNYKYKHLANGKPLTGDKLRTDLQDLADSLSARSSNLWKLGSTQSNESFNNLVASKAPKNRSYGGTKSLLNRVAAAVIQKNEGYIWVNKVNKAALLSPGTHSAKYGIRMDKIRLTDKLRKSSRAFKRKRLLKKTRRISYNKLQEIKEGPTYGEEVETQEVDIEPIPSKPHSPEKENHVVFDLETTGLSRKSDIIQLAAYDGQEVFNKYIIPSTPISPTASSITGLQFNFQRNQMFHNGQQVECIDVRIALLALIEYLSKRNRPLLVGHNIAAYDVHILLRVLEENHFLSEFMQHIGGCLDTLKLAKKSISKEEVKNYKQETLVSTLLGKSYNAHDALQDVVSLHERFVNKLQSTCTVNDVFPFNLAVLADSYSCVVNKSVISRSVARRLANCGLALQHLKLAYRRDTEEGIRSVLSEHGFQKKAVQAFISYFGNVEE